MQKYIRFGFIPFILILLSSPIFAEEPSPTPAVANEYRIAIEDTLSIQVWQHTDLNVTATVGPDGSISMPLVGDVVLKGLTKKEAGDVITAKLKKYVKEPVVTILVTTYGGRRIRVLGQVTSPGSISFSGQMTLLEAISRAGGPTAAAQLHQCSVFRGTETVYEVDLYELLYNKNMKLDIPLQPGDTVFIPDNTNSRVIVLGEVKTPGIYDLGNKLTALEAIAKAGSYTNSANLTQVCIVRGDLQKPEIIQLNISKQILKGTTPKQQILKPNDIVFVPKGIIGKLNFVIDELTPSLRAIILGDSAIKAIQGKDKTGITISP
ncbi:MAG: polysaccharide biosynthesis/export family protein [bacterium]